MYPFANLKQESVRSVLVARVQDTNTEVLEALYENAQVITPIFLSNPQDYLSSLSTTMLSQTKLKRSVIRLHLSYLLSAFSSKVGSALQEEIFHQIIFPFLLFSKSRQKTSDAVWEIIDSNFLHLSGSAIAEWLSGCPALIKAEKSTDGDEVAVMNQMNCDISERIAR